MQNGKGIWDSTVSASQESWTNQINWIVRKKRKGGMTDAQIAKSMNVPVIRVKKLWFRYVNRTGTITYPLRMSRQFHALPRMDAIDRFMDWYNHDRAHRSLDRENQEIPVQAACQSSPGSRYHSALLRSPSLAWWNLKMPHNQVKSQRIDFSK